MDSEINKVKLGEREIDLTLEEAKNLQALLDSILGTKTQTVVIERTPSPWTVEPSWIPAYPLTPTYTPQWAPVYTCCANGKIA